MKPMPGMVPIAEYPTRWEANVAAARLEEAGFESTVLVDPATDVAPHHVTDRVAILVVREEVAVEAAEVLGIGMIDEEGDRLDAEFHERHFADRPPWIRYTTWALLIAIPGPIVIIAIWVLWTLLRGLFP